MNFTENFQEFSARLSRTDLALYAGVGIVLWVMFKDRMSPVQKLVSNLMTKVTSVVNTDKVSKPTSVAVVSTTITTDKQDVFFELVVSWKQTRDLAVKSGCAEAVKVADQMFPFLSPAVCGAKEDKVL